MASTGRIIVREIDKGWNALVASMRAAKQYGSHVKVGFLDDGGKASETHTEGGDFTVAQLAATLEYGTEDGHIPPRPFVGGTFEKNRERYIADLAVLLGKVYEGKLDVRKMLGIMGLRMVSDINRAVRSGDGIPPPNADSTIAAKGSDRPLIDTARMIAALAWAVFMSGAEEERGGPDA